MAGPDIGEESGATPGEWKALLAPMLRTAASAEDITGYVVVTVSACGCIEVRTNLGDGTLRGLLRFVTPEAAV